MFPRVSKYGPETAHPPVKSTAKFKQKAHKEYLHEIDYVSKYIISQTFHPK